MEQNLPPPADLSQWVGGLEGGPLVFYVPDVAAVVLGPTDGFKSAIISRVGNRLVAGVQGLVTALPANHTTRFALLGRNDGITAAMMSAVLRIDIARGADAAPAGGTAPG